MSIQPRGRYFEDFNVGDGSESRLCGDFAISSWKIVYAHF